MKKSTLLVITLFTAFLSGCGQVDSGEAGFFTRWGEVVSREPISEGLHFYEPFGTDLVTYNLRNQVATVTTEVFTKDVQAAKVQLSVTYCLDRNKVIDLHRGTGRKYADVLITPSVLGAVKDALGKMEAGDIIANRQTAAEGIAQALAERLTPFGIVVRLVNITNVDYSDAFERSVEEKQVALQRSIKERNETARLKEVAAQEVVKAEADAKAKVLTAKAEAEAMVAKAKAEAESIEMRNKALASSHALIEYETVKRWDGKLPVQMLGGAPIPFLNMEAAK